jgi:hypothetical protein
MIKKINKSNMRNSEKIKRAKISGKAHRNHKNNKDISFRSPCFSFNCNCSCYSKFSNEQIMFVFNQYYSLESHSHQYSYLKGISH